MGPMCRHALAYCDGQLWGFGGFDGQDTLGDTFCLALGGLVQPAVPSNPSGSTGQSSVQELGDASAEKLGPAQHRSGTQAVGGHGLLGNLVQLALSGLQGQGPFWGKGPAEERPQQLPGNSSSAVQGSEQQHATATVPGGSDLQRPQEQPGRHDSGPDAPPPSKLPGTACNLRRLKMNFLKPGTCGENPVLPTDPGCNLPSKQATVCQELHCAVGCSNESKRLDVFGRGAHQLVSDPEPAVA